MAQFQQFSLADIVGEQDRRTVVNQRLQQLTGKNVTHSLYKVTSLDSEKKMSKEDFNDYITQLGFAFFSQLVMTDENYNHLTYALAQYIGYRGTSNVAGNEISRGVFNCAHRTEHNGENVLAMVPLRFSVVADTVGDDLRRFGRNFYDIVCGIIDEDDEYATMISKKHGCPKNLVKYVIDICYEMPSLPAQQRNAVARYRVAKLRSKSEVIETMAAAEAIARAKFGIMDEVDDDNDAN